MVYNLGVDGRGGIRVVLVGDSNQVQKDKLLSFFFFFFFNNLQENVLLFTSQFLSIIVLLCSLSLDKINQQK